MTQAKTILTKNQHIEQKSYLFHKITQSRYAKTTNRSPYEIRFPLFQALTDIQNKSKVKSSKGEKKVRALYNKRKRWKFMYQTRVYKLKLL